MPCTQLAAQIYTVRDSLAYHAEKKLPDVCRRIREIGYDAVEAIHPLIEDPQFFKKAASDAGLAISSAHVGADKVFADPEWVISLKELLGTDQIVIPTMPGRYRGDAAKAKEFIAQVQDAGARLAELGVVLSYHNHSFEFQKFEGKTIFEMLLEMTQPEHVKIQFDTYWIQHGGGDVAAWLRRIEDRISSLHLKDMGMLLKQQIYMEPGEGNLNWPAILKAARAAGITRYIVELDSCPREPFESLALAYRNCRAMGIG